MTTSPKLTPKLWHQILNIFTDLSLGLPEEYYDGVYEDDDEYYDVVAYEDEYDEMINFNNSDTIIMNDTNPEVYAYPNVDSDNNEAPEIPFEDELPLVYEDNELSQDEFAEARNPYCKIYNRIITCQNIWL